MLNKIKRTLEDVKSMAEYNMYKANIAVKRSTTEVKEVAHLRKTEICSGVRSIFSK